MVAEVCNFGSIENIVLTYLPRCSVKIRFYLRAALADVTVVHVETTHAFAAATPVQIICYIAEITHITIDKYAYPANY